MFGELVQPNDEAGEPPLVIVQLVVLTADGHAWRVLVPGEGSGHEIGSWRRRIEFGDGKLRLGDAQAVDATAEQHLLMVEGFGFGIVDVVVARGVRVGRLDAPVGVFGGRRVGIEAIGIANDGGGLGTRFETGQDQDGPVAEHNERALSGWMDADGSAGVPAMAVADETIGIGFPARGAVAIRDRERGLGAVSCEFALGRLLSDVVQNQDGQHDQNAPADRNPDRFPVHPWPPPSPQLAILTRPAAAPPRPCGRATPSAK
jgi:hypothetical protein